MRVADKMAFNHVNRNISRNRSEMADLQDKAATQKKVNKPSDDPLAATRVLGFRTEEKVSSQFIKNINVARAFLEFTDQSLSETTEALSRAKELALSQSSDASTNTEARKAVAEELSQMLSQVVQIGNRKLGERYIFGGYRTETQPFDKHGNYGGDDGQMQLQIQKDAFVPINVSGDKVFLGLGPKTTPQGLSPRAAEQIPEYRQSESDRKIANEEKLALEIPIVTEDSNGINLFKTLQKLEVSLRTDDKAGIQETLDELDAGINQVIQARSQVGSRIQTLNQTEQSLQKVITDSKLNASLQEDADAFQVVSDINKTDSTLRATLETSGKLIQPSLLDFLK